VGAGATADTRVRVGGRTVAVSSLDKVLFPEDGITKGELIEYYTAVAPHMLPHLKDRPVNLERFPDGIARGGFFQQAMPDSSPDWIEVVTVEKARGRVRHVVIQTAATLVYLANQACITPHAWLSRRDRLDYPDQLVFDLDPPDQDPEGVRNAARALGELLRELELVPFLKTTGSRGYHVLVPLDRREDFDAVRTFARAVAALLVKRHPKELTVEARKAKRRERIYVDTMRNAYAHTAVPAYAVRAQPKAPVATPIGWEELEDQAMHPARFTLRNLPTRLRDQPDPWRDFRRRARGLASARRRLEELTPRR
jgi:bifunctional non-homologous end joining protein LigD